MKLTTKQETFINEYCIDQNGTQAYIRSGYKVCENTAKVNASRLLTNVNIKGRIDDILKERALNNGITAEFVLNGIKAIAMGGERESDKIKAYELLGKHLKLFTDKIESDNTNHNIEIKLDNELADWAK